MYCPCSENKGADQLRGYREADLRLCFRICKKPVFSRCGSNTTKGEKYSDFLKTLSHLVSAHSISQRVIYTFHPIEKTWNEARNICEDRQGQLVKLESSAQEEEILYLGSNIYPGSM